MLKKKALLFLPVLTLAPMLFWTSCNKTEANNSNNSGNTSSNDTDANSGLDSGSSKVNTNSLAGYTFSVDEWDEKVKKYTKNSSNDLTLTTEELKKLENLINSASESIDGASKIPLEKMNLVRVKFKDSNGQDVVKTFAECLKLLGVTLLQDKASSNVKLEQLFLTDIFDDIFVKYGEASKAESLEARPEWKNYLLSAEDAESNPLYKLITKLNYQVVSANVVPSLSPSDWGTIEYNLNKNIEEMKKKTFTTSSTHNKSLSTNRAEVDKVLNNFPSRLNKIIQNELANSGINQNQAQYLKEEAALSIVEKTVPPTDVSDYFKVVDNKLFLSKTDSMNNPVDISWLQFLPVFESSVSKRALNVNDKIKVLLNVPNGTSETEYEINIPLKKANLINELLVKTENTNLRETVTNAKGETILKPNFKYGSYDEYVTLFNINQDLTSEWPSTRKIRFVLPNGEVSNEMNGYQIDDETNTVKFKGNLYLGVNDVLKVNVVETKNGKQELLTTTKTFNVPVSAIPENSFEFKFVANPGIELKEWMGRNTVLGKLVVSNAETNEKIQVQDLNLNNHLGLNENNEIYVKSDFLRLATLGTKDGGSAEFKFSVFSSAKGKSISKLLVGPIKSNTFNLSSISSTFKGLSNGDKTMEPTNPMYDHTNVKWFAPNKTKGSVVVEDLKVPSGYKVELANLHDLYERNSITNYDLFQIKDNRQLIYVGSETVHQNVFTIAYLLTNTSTGQKHLLPNVNITFEKTAPTTINSTDSNQDLNALLKSATTHSNSENATYGELKNYIKVPQVLAGSSMVTSTENVQQSNLLSKNYRNVSNTVPSRPFLPDAANVPHVKQFISNGFASKAFNTDETLKYKFKTTQTLKNIVIYSLLPDDSNSYGVFKDNYNSRGTTKGLNSIWGGQWQISEWKKYLEISYVKSDGTTVVVDPQDYLVTRVKEYTSTIDGVTKYLQMISVTLSSATAIDSVSIKLKAIPTNDAPTDQIHHTLSKVLFGK